MAKEIGGTQTKEEKKVKVKDVRMELLSGRKKGNMGKLICESQGEGAK